MNTWRVIIQEDNKPSWNMAVDHAIMDAVSEEMAPPTIRLYRWDGVAVTLGHNQIVESGVKLQECSRRSIPIIRRITGGRGILHGGDQGITICIPPSEGWSKSISGNYAKFAEGFNTALMRMGLETQQGYSQKRQHHVADCFALRSEADILCANGEKVLGCAQRRMKRVILEQCSLRHQPSLVSSSDVFIGCFAHSDYPLQDIEEGIIIQSLLDGFASALSIHFEENSLTMWELERACYLLPDYSPLNPIMERFNE